MTILTSLVKAYDRLPDAPPIGYSSEKIGYAISLNADGSVAHVIDLREGEGKKARPRHMLVPSSFKRPGITPRSFFLWDNSAYVLGVSSDSTKDASARLQAFRELHLSVLKDESDIGLLALCRFVSSWKPELFQGEMWSEEMKGQNIVFSLEEDRHSGFIHERRAARAVWERLSGKDVAETGVCLVTGEHAPIARLHNAIKGVWGGQVAGGSIVSFNLDAFTSYGHDRGENAPVSETAAFKYTTVLNRFLERDSGHRVQIGDASTVFWADATDMKAAKEAESLFTMFIEPEGQKGGTAEDDKAATRDIDIHLKRIREGLPLSSIEPELAEGVRFYVLGLAPNAARLSVRFFFADTFGVLTKNYQRFLADMRIDPPPQEGYPPLWRYLQETAVLGKRDNVPPNLAGEWMRAILSGTRYPLTLLSSVLMRIRSDGHINPRRVSILKAVLIRNFNREAPVALDPDYTNKGYLLGRLFAVYEQIQTAALGSRVNATVKDKFYGSASAQPRKAFALLESGSANHLSKIGKQKPGYKVNLEKAVAGIMEQMSPCNDPFPASLNAEEQALFGLGYYHQRNAFFKKPAETAETNGESEE